MRRLLGSEVRKVLTTRTAAGLVAAAAAVAVLGVVSVIGSQPVESLEGPFRRSAFFLIGGFNIALFALLVGIRVVTDDIRAGTIVPTVLATPKRGRVFLAQAATAALVGATLAVVSQLAMVAVAIPMLGGKGVSFLFGGADAISVAAVVVISAAWAVIGVGVGAAIRHQVAAIAGALVWMLVVENIGPSAFGEAARFLPGQAVQAIVGGSSAPNLLPAALGAAVFAAYVAVIGITGVRLFARRDVAID